LSEDLVLSAEDTFPTACPYFDEVSQRADALGILILRISDLDPVSPLYILGCEMGRALISSISSKPKLSIVK